MSKGTTLLRRAAATGIAIGATAIPLVAMAGGITSNDLGIQYGTATGLSTRDVREVVASIINVAMGLLGIVAVVIILIGGFTWMTAGGADEKVEAGKKWITQGVIGLAIILTSYAIARFVISSLVKATGDGSGV